MPEAFVVDLLDEGIYQDYLANPDLFHQGLNHLKPRSWVVVDEIQRLPALLNGVHRLIEHRSLRFALTGSSARKLRRSGVNLLGGRALWKSMYPLTALEMEADFQIDEALRIGTIPLIVAAKDPAARLSAYVQMYLKEEIKAEALVRNLEGFARFLPVMALFHGQIMNVSNLARDAGVSRTTIQGFVDIMVDTLLVNRLPAFEGRLRVKERRHPKTYWIDAGLVRAAKKQRGSVAPEEKGALLEGIVYMHLLAARDAFDLFDDVFYWAPTESKHTEVDFLLTRAEEFIAVEVKSATRLRDEHFLGLRAIAKLKGVRRRILVYLGNKTLRLDDGIEVWPVEKLLAEIAKL